MALTQTTWIGQGSNANHNSSTLEINDAVVTSFDFDTAETFLGDLPGTAFDESADDTVTYTLDGIVYTDVSFDIVNEGFANSGNGGSGGSLHAYIEITITSGADAGSSYVIVTDGSDPSPNGGNVPAGLFKKGNHTATTDGDLVAFCFVSGTMISCATGQVAVENLNTGDTVATISSGDQKIRWIGKTVVLANKPNQHLLPIRIKAGALGDNTPSADLLVSPAHRMLFSGWRAELLFGQPEVLVSAKSLVNDSTITVARDLKDFTYFHIMFDKHEIVLSNGAASESFHPNQDAFGVMDTATRDEILELFPELANGNGNGAKMVAVRPMLSDAEAMLLS
ncbi:MAG: Hint domain-containing protein [Rhodobacteraceae bacterium]|nr:Hint domain-containing protein [Paracoccaceae bacterium]